MHRLIRLSLTAIAAGLAAVAVTAPAAAVSEVYNPHLLHSRSGAHAAGSATPLVYNGGAVETTPAVYIDYWGSQWASGFSSGGYSSSQAMTYNNDFFGSVGGTGWANTDSQYSGITNPSGQLKGSYVHNVALPRRINQSAIAAEAVWAMNNVFGGYNPNATYFVYTPSGHSMSGFKSSWCAWHSSTSSGGNLVAYAYMPYQPDAGYSCGINSVNANNNSFGNGYFDGFSIVGGHEYSEAVTDPHPNTGWLDSSGSEIGDKCAWTNLSNLSAGGHNYAVQPLFSNHSLSCVLSYP